MTLMTSTNSLPQNALKQQIIDCILTGIRLDLIGGEQRTAITELTASRVFLKQDTFRSTADGAWIEVDDGYQWTRVSAGTMRLWLQRENLPEDALTEVQPASEQPLVTCDMCGGSGELLCRSCGGTGGHYNSWGDIVDCPECGGDAVSECKHCKGTGKLEVKPSVYGYKIGDGVQHKRLNVNATLVEFRTPRGIATAHEIAALAPDIYACVKDNHGDLLGWDFSDLADFPRGAGGGAGPADDSGVDANARLDAIRAKFAARMDGSIGMSWSHEDIELLLTTIDRLQHDLDDEIVTFDDTAPYGIGDLVEHQSDGRIGAVIEIWQRPDSGQWIMSVRAADNGAIKKWLAEDVELYSAFTPDAETGPVTR